MKKIIVFLSLVFLSIASNAQSLFEYITIPRNPTTNIPEWNGVVNVDSMLTQKELYEKAFQWVIATWANPKEVIQYQDPVSGYICVTGTVAVSTSTSMVKHIDMGYYHYTMNIWVKDGRYKYQIKDIYRKEIKYGYTGQYEDDISIAKSGKRSVQEVVSQMYDTAQALVKSLEVKMTEVPKPKDPNAGGSDW